MSEPSPYQTPESKLNEQMVLPNQEIAIHRVSASRGAFWFFDGFKRLFRSPGIWFTIGLLNLLIVLLLSILSLIPVIGSFLSYLMYPVLVGGFMFACRNQDLGKLSVSDLFAGFSHQTSQLFLAGALYIAMMIGVFVVVMILGFAIAYPLFSGMELDIQRNPEEMIMLIALFVLIFVGLTLPIIMAIWFAPALIILKENEAIPSIKSSFSACLRNFVPYLVYGLVALLFYSVIGLILAMGIGLFAVTDQSPALIAAGVLIGILFMIIVAPATFIGIYSAYLDIFKDIE